MNYRDYNDYELVDMVSETDTAGDIIFKKYYPLVLKIANRYAPLVRNKGIEKNDLIQEGLIGLSEAIRDYQDCKDAKFITFANLCIEREMRTAITRAHRDKQQVLNSSVSIDAVNDTGDNYFMNIINVDTPDPMETLVSYESTLQIKQDIQDKLSNLENDIFELKLANFTNQEISELLDLPYKKVDNSLHRLKTKIGVILKEREESL